MSTSNPTPDVDQLRSATECAKSGEFEQACAHLTALLAAEPDHELAAGMLAAVYAEMKIPERAAENFQRVLRINPDNVLARFQLGLVQLELRQPLAALDTWQPGNYGPNEYLVHFYSGVALMELDQPQAALLRFQTAQQFMPVSHVLYPQLLEFLIKLNN